MVAELCWISANADKRTTDPTERTNSIMLPNHIMTCSMMDMAERICSRDRFMIDVP